MIRSVKKIYNAVEAPIDNLTTYRAMPTDGIGHIDPFLFLNHHGPQFYDTHNNGLPFGPHPHRGFETLTLILEGELMHWDSDGGKNIINSGGIQWMTAGSGLVHAEISSDEFKKTGGTIEIVQIWLNLPARLKMTRPKYIGLQKGQIPSFKIDEGKVTIHAIAGKFNNVNGAVKSLTGIQIAWLQMKSGGIYSDLVVGSRNILFYVVSGRVHVNGKEADLHQLVDFDNNGDEIVCEAIEDSTVIFGHGLPFHEPIVAQGPFVMNNVGEIKQAYLDYQNGKMGNWKNL